MIDRIDSGKSGIRLGSNGPRRLNRRMISRKTIRPLTSHSRHLKHIPVPHCAISLAVLHPPSPAKVRRAMPSCKPLPPILRSPRQAQESVLHLLPLQSATSSWSNGTFCTLSPAGRTSSPSTSPTPCSPWAPKTWKRFASSRRWTDRQGKDQFARAAKVQGLKSRAAFKLLQINEKYRLFKPGMTVIDLGFAPGSWSQV